MTELFWRVTTQSMMGAILICAVLLLRLLFSRVKRSVLCVLWLLVAIRLVVPFTIESPIAFMQDDIFASFDRVVTGDGEVSSAYIPQTEAVTIPEHISPLTELLPNTATSNTPDSAYKPYRNDIPTFGTEKNTATARVAYGTVFSHLWMLGMIVMLTPAVFDYAKIKKRTSISIPFDGKKTIRICDAIPTPFIFGMVKPVIYLPSAFAEHASAETVETVLAHEKAHIRHFDHLWKPLAYLVLILHWFNPFVWIAYAVFCRDLELLCDERVTRTMPKHGVRVYADALLACSLSNDHAAGRRIPFAGPLAFGEIGVKPRIRHILSGKRAGIFLTVLCILLIAILAVCAFTVLQDEEDAIVNQRGYRIVEIGENREIMLTVPIGVLNGNAYTREGQTFEDGEVVVYDGGATKVSLVRVYRMSSSGVTNGKVFPLSFSFRFSSDNVGDAGVITVMSRPNYKGTKPESYTSGHGLGSDEVQDAHRVYIDAARIGGSGYGDTVFVYFDEETVKNADTYLRFSITGVTDLFYERGRANDAEDMIVTTGGKVLSQRGPDRYKEAGSTYYVPEECLMLSGFSSYMPLGGNNGYLYCINPETVFIATADRENGRELTVLSEGGTWNAFPYSDEEWRALFGEYLDYEENEAIVLGASNGISADGFTDARDLSHYKEKYVTDMGNGDKLFYLDGELWVVRIGKHPDGTEYLWSIYRLVPESEKGEAYWNGNLMRNAVSPYFDFSFEIDGVKSVRIGCEDEQLLTSDRTIQDRLLTITGENAEFLWSAYGDLTEGSDTVPIPVAYAAISLWIETEDRMYYGVIYIEQIEKDASGTTTFRATIAGNGLCIRQGSYDDGVIFVQ